MMVVPYNGVEKFLLPSGREANPIWRISNGFMEKAVFSVKCQHIVRETGDRNSQQKQFRENVCGVIRNLARPIREENGNQGLEK